MDRRLRLVMDLWTFGASETRSETLKNALILGISKPLYIDKAICLWYLFLIYNIYSLVF